jgi:hypothetical protein
VILKDAHVCFRRGGRPPWWHPQTGPVVEWWPEPRSFFSNPPVSPGSA